MCKPLAKLYILLLFFLSLSFSFVFAEELTITTYYPSPYGSYNELTAYKIKIGDSYSGSSYAVGTDNLVVEGRVGIGTYSPTVQLQVVKEGGAAGDWVSLDASSGTVNISSGEALYVNAGGSGSGQYFSANDFRTGTLGLGYQITSPFITTEANKDLTINAASDKVRIEDDLGVKKTPGCSLDVNGTICGGATSASSLSVNSISASSINAGGDIIASGTVQAAQDIRASNALCIRGDCRTSWPGCSSCPTQHTGHEIVVIVPLSWGQCVPMNTMNCGPGWGASVLAGMCPGCPPNMEYKCATISISTSS